MALPLLASAHWPSRKQGQCGGAAARMASGLARRLREVVRPEVWLSSQGGPRCRGRDTSPRRSLRSCARWTCWLYAVSARETDRGYSGREDFWFIVAIRSEDEAEIRAGETAGGSGREGPPACDAPAVLGRGEDPHRARGPAG